MNFRPNFVALAAALFVLGLSGCAALAPVAPTPLAEKIRTDVSARQAVPIALAPPSRVIESTAAFIPLTPRKVSELDWLRSKKVALALSDKSVPLSELVRMLSRQGINVTSELPLDRYVYTGYSMTDVSADTALRIILGSAGLDFQADAARKLITIKPLSSRSWYLNIGNRRSNYVVGGGQSTSSSGGSQGGGTSGASSGSGPSSGSGSQAGSSGSSGSGGFSGGGQTAATGSSQVSSSDDFWASLRAELDTRLKILMPDTQQAMAQAQAQVATQQAPNAPQLMLPPVLPPGLRQPAGIPAFPPTQPPLAAAPVYPANSAMTYLTKQVGVYAVNPETGAITVQAPHWVLDELDTYFKRVQEMYNTDLVFQGELVLLTSDTQNSEGLDISSFAKFAKGRYGIAYNNNSLGGVTMSFPNGAIPALVSGSTSALAGPLLGVVSALDGLQLFNAYLSNLGSVTTLQRPVLTTTSGVPADFRRTVTRYYNTVSQQTSSGGTGSAAVGTTNQLISQDYGTILRVNPRYDVATGLIRAQIELVQTTQAGTQSIPQSVSSGNSLQQVNSELPIISRILYNGEALLRDGDLVVMGGQIESTEHANRGGIPGLMDSESVGGAFGQSSKSTSKNVFYFALRVSVTKR